MDGEGEAQVPMAPDPPESSSSTSRSKGVRFLAQKTPAPPPRVALSSGSSEAAASAVQEDVVDPYGPRFSRGYESERDERSAYMRYPKRDSDEDYGPRPFHFIFFGFAISATCALLALLPVCTWKSYDARDRHKFQYFCYGIVAGMFVFATWAAALFYVIKSKEMGTL